MSGFVCGYFCEVCLVAPWADFIQIDMRDKLLIENLIITHSIWSPQLKENQVSADDMLQMSLLQGPIQCFQGIFSPGVRPNQKLINVDTVYTGHPEYPVRYMFLHLQTKRLELCFSRGLIPVWQWTSHKLDWPHWCRNKSNLWARPTENFIYLDFTSAQKL